MSRRLAHLIGDVGLRVSKETSRFPTGLKGVPGEADSRTPRTERGGMLCKVKPNRPLVSHLPNPTPQPNPLGVTGRWMIDKQTIDTPTATVTLLFLSPNLPNLSYGTGSGAKNLGRHSGWGLIFAQLCEFKGTGRGFCIKLSRLISQLCYELLM